MSSRRSTLELQIAVLRVINSGTSKPTRVMYEANISWQPLMRILNKMIDKGLIESGENTSRDKRTHVRYYITIRGQRVLKAHRALMETMP